MYHKSKCLFSNQPSDTSLTETQEERGRLYHLAAGHEHALHERLDKAIHEYKLALKYDPTSPEPHLQMAALYEKMNQIDLSIESSLEALRLSKELLKSNKFNNEVLSPIKIANEFGRLGRNHVKKENYLEAHRCFRESLVRYSTQSVLQDLRQLESKHFTSKVTRIANIDVKDDKFVSSFIQGLPFIVRDTSIGRGIFATRSFKQGEILFKENPLASIPDLDNMPDTMCYHCLRPLEDTQFGFVSQKIEETANMLPPGQLESLKLEISQGLEIPPLKRTTDSAGNHYCSPDCKSIAHQTYQDTLNTRLAKDSANYKMLLPSHFSMQFNVEDAETEGQNLMLKELSTIEMITRILATLETNPKEMEHLKRLAYIQISPQPLLLEHEQLQLAALQEIFPKFKDEWLTESGFQTLKSIVELNTFSTETQALRIELDESSSPDSELPPDADPDQAHQLGLHILIRDDIQVKGHGLFRLGSMMNHSCDPNVGMSQPSITAKASWVALRDIALGEELFDSYVTLEEGSKHDREVRRNILFENYHFWCNCSLCASGK